MTKSIVFIVGLFFSTWSLAQLSGELTKFKRKIIQDVEYNMTGSKPGVVVYDISVDIKGNVTSATLVKKETNITSTPSLMKAKNAILKMKFDGCTYCPQYHHGFVKITFSKP